ncbi:MAG: trypsin-like peptidase domain-containing protein [Candidatus Saccharibacteria bacterium]|nr:trypsin-like peptidase domain-containing protein [Candidatus Saccharibacteria bacterium]
MQQESMLGQNKDRKGLRVIAWMGIGVGVLLLIAAVVIIAILLQQHKQPPTPERNSVPDGNAIVSVDESDISSVVEKVSPSVVSIITGKSGRGYNVQQGAGTGVIISADGYVMTNKHVIDGATHARIITSAGDSYTRVSFVGIDPLNDIAFLKIKDVSNLTAAALGDSSTVRVGQRVIAIGNSLGQYKNTVTSGIISGKGRPVQLSPANGLEQESLTDLLQTDAAINPGNSGGPLLNLSGQVIGINTAIVSGAQSVGFAIPINATKGLVRGVIDRGEVRRAYIGVRYVTITPEVRAEHGLKERQGALVVRGGDGPDVSGPAEKSGIKVGDVMTRINGKAIGEHGGLSSMIGEFAPGEVIELTVVRDGRERQVALTLGRL